MKPYFGKGSRRNLNTCHSDLRQVAEAVIPFFDFSVTEGHRSKLLQNKYYEDGKSKVRYPDSRHNYAPSEAMHCQPYPTDWQDRERFTLLAGHLLQAAQERGINLRWGGDWDQDTQVKDNTFDDLAHFELR